MLSHKKNDLSFAQLRDSLWSSIIIKNHMAYELLKEEMIGLLSVLLGSMREAGGLLNQLVLILIYKIQYLLIMVMSQFSLLVSGCISKGKACMEMKTKGIQIQVQTGSNSSCTIVETNQNLEKTPKALTGSRAVAPFLPFPVNFFFF